MCSPNPESKTFGTKQREQLPKFLPKYYNLNNLKQKYLSVVCNLHFILKFRARNSYQFGNLAYLHFLYLYQNILRKSKSGGT